MRITFKHFSLSSLILTGLCCISAVQAQTANAYVLDGNPTGLTAYMGNVTFANGSYSGSAWGNAASVTGTAVFKFKWEQNPAQPEPPPLSAIVRVEASSMVRDYTTIGSYSNGYQSWNLVGQLGGASASEYFVKESPGNSFEVSVPIHATTGGVAGVSALASVKVTAVPVAASVSGVTWHGEIGQPKTARILIGQKAVGALTTGGHPVTNSVWTVPGTTFKDYDPTLLPATPSGAPNQLINMTASDWQVPAPTWYWTAAADEILKPKVAATVSFPSNQYKPQSAQVTDEFTVTVMRPISNVRQIWVNGSKPVLTSKSFGSADPWRNWLNVETSCDSREGTVALPSGFQAGGEYFFTQIITSSRRQWVDLQNTPPHNEIPKDEVLTQALDAEFTYPFAKRSYPIGERADFEDYPAQHSKRIPLDVNDQFKTWIMFIPPGAGSKPVPVMQSTWYWTAVVQAPYSPGDRLGEHSSTAWQAASDHPGWKTVKTIQN